MNISSRSRRPSGFGSLRQRRHRPDYWLVILSVIMLVIGLIVVYAISPALSAQQNVGDNYYINKQLIAVGLGIAGFIAVANLPISLWRKIERPLIISSVIAALIVRLFGDQVNGAYRWIQVGGFSFQAAELIKLALLIGLAGFLSNQIKNNEITDTNKTFKPLLMTVAVIAFVVGLIQKDLGSTGVMVAMMIAMVYVAGLPLKRIALVAGSLVVAVVILVLPFSYRRDRLMTFLHPAQDCLNTGYQSCQALITVGSGGIIGKGLGNGVQAYGYLPEAANDSIFAIFAEKFGFIGVTVLLGLFVAFFSRLRRIIERAPDNYSRLLATGILAWLSTQTIINVGAMIGLLPLKGITLPFISYG
ncbi:MAG: FtsW/RodA/SpoVE family cell cycle protein, partial [Candidatus Saccharimonadales bacterium]